MGLIAAPSPKLLFTASIPRNAVKVEDIPGNIC
jgi:hypothetical protein